MENPLLRAKGYPYTAPDHDYLFRGGVAEPLPAPYDFAGRVPVVGIGSNRSPLQLARKYGASAEIPVTWAVLDGFDVVYAAHVSYYGSVTATLHPSPGTRVTVAVTWLDPAQLAAMHATEGGYHFGWLSGGALVERRTGKPLPRAGLYVCKAGALVLEGEPVALAAITAEGRRFRALGQEEKMALVASRVGGVGPLDDWLLAHIGHEQDAPRARLNARLEALGITFSHPAYAIDESGPLG